MAVESVMFGISAIYNGFNRLIPVCYNKLLIFTF
jgi:hypothetical protein